jgi:acid phosphatase
MPARYYKLEKNIDSSHAVLFLFTDTSPFIREYFSYTMADLKKQDTTAQLKWLRQSLLGSNDTWKIVVGHHPLYSVGLHGNVPELIGSFKPVFLQSKTDFYLAGHDHSLQYHTIPAEGIRYLVSAGGSETYKVGKSPTAPFAAASAGFLVMTLYTDAARFYFFDQYGQLLYKETVTK